MAEHLPWFFSTIWPWVIVVVHGLVVMGAFDDMATAIDAAQRSIGLMAYIFDNDAVGRRFADALARAHDRGVAVRVLIDDVGARYTWPSIKRRLRARKVPLATFLPTL